MGKAKYYVDTKEFQLVKHGGKRTEMYLTFDFKDTQVSYYTSVCYTLSDQEWKNLVKFLKNTKTRKHLPKDAEGYQGYVIDRGKPMYYRFKHIKMLMKMFIPDERRTDLTAEQRDIIACQKRDLKDVKKHHIYRSIHLTVGKVGNVSMHMDRKKFLRFRKFILNAEKHLN